MYVCTYQSLDHFHPLVPQLGEDAWDVHSPLTLSLLEGNVYRCECTCATHTSAACVCMCEGCEYISACVCTCV